MHYDTIDILKLLMLTFGRRVNVFHSLNMFPRKNPKDIGHKINSIIVIYIVMYFPLDEL